MVTFEDDEENGAGSPGTSSENDGDEPMEDADDGDGDMDQEADQDMDGDGDNDGDDDEGDNDDEDDQDDQEPESPSQGRGANGINRTRSGEPARPTVSFTSPSPRPSAGAPQGLIPRPSVKPEALTSISYDIVPTMAAPHSTSINAVTTTPDMRWIFSGGTDGYIRKFHWPDTVNGKLPLTVAQKHPFVDSVTKAGVLLSYWENEEYSPRTPPNPLDESPNLSPVYSLAVHNQGLWLLSGLESGGINLQSVRHDEGRRITCLRKHTSAVSVLTLAQDEKSVLSGSWDKTILDWDLNTGGVKRAYTGSGGQISTIEARPQSSLPVPEESGQPIVKTETFSSNNANRPTANGFLSNGVAGESSSGKEKTEENGDANGSPDDSLFGDKDSLFGDDKDVGGAPSGAAFGDDEDDEFSRAIANEIQQQQDEDANGVEDTDMLDAGGPVQPPDASADTKDQNAATQEGASASNGDAENADAPLTNGLPRSEEGIGGPSHVRKNSPDPVPSSESTFLDASMDGTLRVWDRRQPNPVARILPRNTAPWCMNASWSPDGNFIYAGRRNGTVDEYSLHKGLREPRRTFKFPAGSGPVSALQPMPNGQHLVCASFDILRLYDLKEQDSSRHSAVPFLIVPGHRTGMISQLYLDPTCSFLISTAGNRGWEGSTTEVLLGYEIGTVQ